MNVITLNNGVEMPQVGLGLWQAENGNEAKNAVLQALEFGYRLIDTAKIYGNESSVGQAIKESGVDRKELFVTTKLWNSDQGYESAKRAYEESLQRLGMDYIDLYLIHWPAPAKSLYLESWQAMEELYEAEKVRAIGVSNFLPEHLEILMKGTTVVPAVNQIELHPRLQQRKTREFCDQQGIVVESYSPLMQGGEMLQHDSIVSLSAKYMKTPAQIVLRWHVQNGLIAIPKSVTPQRIKENISIFDFELSQNDMTSIDSLDADTRILAHPNDLN